MSTRLVLGRMGPLVLGFVVAASVVAAPLAQSQTQSATPPAQTLEQVLEQVAADPRDPSGYLTLAGIYIEQGRFAQAEQMIRNALALTRELAASQPVDPADQLIGPTGPVRIGGDVAEPMKVKDVKPVYPADAQAAGITGLVIVEAVIGRDGRVQDARVLRSVPELDGAALDAVSQWEYTPTLLGGQPVEVIMTVTVNFSGG